MLFVLLIFFFFQFCFSNAQVLDYDQMQVNEDRIIIKDGKLVFSIFKGKFKKVWITLNFKPVQVQDLVLEFQDTVAQRDINWELKVESVFFKDEKKIIDNFCLKSDYKAFLKVKKIEIDGEILSCSNLSFATQDDVFGWKAKSKDVKINDDFVFLNENSFELFKLALPIFNITRKRIPSSGFHVPKFSKDSDGFKFSVPYYFYFNKRRNMMISPMFGTTKLALEFNYQELFQDFVLLFDAEGVYYYSDQNISGGLLQFSQHHLKDNVAFNFDLFLPSSLSYLKSYREKKQRSKKEHIPFHFYYAKEDKYNLGINGFFSCIDDSYLIIPHFEFKKKFSTAFGTIRFNTGFDFMNNILTKKGKKNIFGINHSSIVGYNFIYSTNSIVHETEVGVRLNIADDNFAINFDSIKFRPFISHSSSSMFNFSGVLYNFYAKGKVKANDGKDREFLNYEEKEFLHDLNTNAIFKGGIEVFYDNLSWGIGYFNDGGNHNILMDCAYVKDSFFGTIKVCKDKYISADVGYLNDFFDVRGSYLNFCAFDKSCERVELVANVDFSNKFSVKFDLGYGLKPIQDVAKAGLKLVYKTEGWIFDIGISYIANNKQNDLEDRFAVTFELKLNGLDEFSSVYNKIFKARKDIDFQRVFE